MINKPLRMHGCDTPRDWKDPKWTNDRVHNWHNYIPPDIRTMWPTLSDETRIIAAWMAEYQAGNEDWD